MKAQKISKLLMLLAVVLCLFSVTLFAQNSDTTANGTDSTEQELIEPELALQYWKKNNIKHLICKMNATDADGNSYPLKGLTLTVTVEAESSMKLADIITNSEGEAEFRIDAAYKLPKAADGSTTFKVAYEGNETINATESTVSAVDIRLELSLSETDSTKVMTVKGFEIKADGTEVPLNEMEVFFFVPRMFSDLKIADGFFVEGEASALFPLDLPADTAGMVTIIARVAEHDRFANVDVRVPAKWGVATDHFVAKSYRALWTQIAPTWMIITLTIMLVGVWGHYAFVIISLIKIKRSSKKTA